MSTSHAVLKLFRKLHLYIGVFVTPALLFFAFTGALQTFSLHETNPGSSYKPPSWIVTLAQLHKKQTVVVPARKSRPIADAPRPGKLEDAGTTKGPDAPKPKTHLPMKIFFLLVAIGLFTSTVTGLYMSYKYTRNRLAVTILLLAGIVVPLLLLRF